MVISGDEPHRFLIHDHDSVYSDALDRTIANMGLTILKTPVRSPQANAFCERLIGTIRRECLDWVIPLNEGHLRRALQTWVGHYNRGRPHASLGRYSRWLCERGGIERSSHPEGYRVVATPILGGLHQIG
jgi:putative transposase